MRATTAAARWGLRPAARSTCRPQRGWAAATLSSVSTPPRGPSGETGPGMQESRLGQSGLRVDRINACLWSYPSTTIGCLIASEIVSIYSTYFVLSLLNVQVGSGFALAFALNRGLRRLKTPVDLLVAAGLVQVAPWLSRIRLGPFVTLLHQRLFPNRTPGSALTRVVGLMDKFGAGYFLAARWTGVASTLLIYAGLSYGVDVDALFATMGLSAGTGAVLGTWAAAVVGSAALFPLTSYVGAALVAPRIAKVLRF